MRITEIRVRGLFGTFNHVIPLTNADPVTIIHGPNGVGKTVVLRMIASLLEGETGIFERIPFTDFRVTLDNGTMAMIRSTNGNSPRGSRQPAKLSYSFLDASGRTIGTSTHPILPEVPTSVLDKVDRFVPGPLHRWETGWRDDTGTVYTLSDILKRFPAAIEALPKKYRPKVFEQLPRDLEVFFIETKRLDAQAKPTRPSPGEYRVFSGFSDDIVTTAALRVDQYSRDVAQRIKAALADYAKHSQERDRAFPERLVRFVRERHEVLAERDILERISALEDKRQRLISLGFLDREPGFSDLTEEDVKRAPEALTIYVGDMHEKLAVFDDLAQRVGRLMDIINDRFRYKQLAIHREDGFRVSTDSGTRIQLEDLSSGEQQELVVLYELLFRSPTGGLILVDEPEISLHVAWQQRFISDLIGILNLSDSYGIVATHSPVIIDRRWDLTVQLGGRDHTMGSPH